MFARVVACETRRLDPAVRAGDPLITGLPPLDAHSGARRARPRLRRTRRLGAEHGDAFPPAPRSRSTTPSRSPGATIPSTCRRPTSRRTADAAVRSARGALLPSADASFGSRYQQGGQQVFNGLSFSNSSDAVQSSYGLNLNYRVNTRDVRATRRPRSANRDAVEADITGSGEQLRAAVTQQYLSVLQAQARVGAAGHAGEDGRRRSSSWPRRKLAVGLGHARSTSAAPRWRSARQQVRAAHGAQQRRGREAAALPADGRASSRPTSR